MNSLHFSKLNNSRGPRDSFTLKVPDSPFSIEVKVKDSELTLVIIASAALKQIVFKRVAVLSVPKQFVITTSIC